MSALLSRLAATASLAALLAAPAAAGDEPDLLVLRGGERIDCRVLLEGEEHLVYRAGNRTRTAPAAEIAEVRSVERELRAFLQRYAGVDRRDPQALYELGLYAEAHRLPGEARNAWLRVLTLVPDHAGAWIKLGGVKREGGWELKLHGGFYSLDELRPRAGQWDGPLELSSAHFRIRTDASLERALDAAVDLERAWMAFYDLLGEPLGLYVFDAAPEVRGYADRGEIPAPRPGQEAWFDPAANVLYLPLYAGRDRGPSATALADCLVQNSFRPTFGRAGEIEPWALMGLGDVCADAVRPVLGRSTVDLGPLSRASFEAHARDGQ